MSKKDALMNLAERFPVLSFQQFAIVCAETPPPTPQGENARVSCFLRMEEERNYDEADSALATELQGDLTGCRTGNGGN